MILNTTSCCYHSRKEPDGADSYTCLQTTRYTEPQKKRSFLIVYFIKSRCHPRSEW